MLSSKCCDGADHISSAVDKVFKKRSCVVFDIVTEHVNNLSIDLNSRTTTDIKILHLKTLLLILVVLMDTNNEKT